MSLTAAFTALLPFVVALGAALGVATFVIVGVAKIEHMKATGHPAVGPTRT
ncbi:hypothetical protein [Nocardioides pakistanensis]